MSGVTGKSTLAVVRAILPEAGAPGLTASEIAARIAWDGSRHTVMAALVQLVETGEAEAVKIKARSTERDSKLYRRAAW